MTRLAWRQLRQSWVSSLLVTTLIALPIAGMTGYAVYQASSTGTTQERVRVELGQMAAWIQPSGIAGAGMRQSPIEPQLTGYPQSTENAGPQSSPPPDPVPLLPAGTEVIEVTNGAVRVPTTAGVALVDGWTGAVWDERFTGRFDLIDGRRPMAADEAMTTPATLERLGVRIGGRLSVTGLANEVTIVGTLDAATLPDSRSAVFLAGTAETRAIVDGEHRWYLPGWSPGWEDVQRLNDGGVVAYSRAVFANPPGPSEIPEVIRFSSGQANAALQALLLPLIAGGLFAGYVVVMLAGAAFAVTARRQQRSLAIVASVGGSQRDIFRTVVLQGTLLGIIGGTVGAAMGVGLGALVLRLVDDGSATRVWGFHLPWAVVVGVLLFATLVGTASALVPARTVARSDVIGALRGARRPQRARASRPIWGSVLVGAGVAVTLVCAVALSIVIPSQDVPPESPLRTLLPYGIILGPVMAQIGILLSGRWLLWLVALPLSRCGTAARLAVRDAAASAGRTVPAFAAIAATIFVGVFALGQASMQTAQTARNWSYGAPVGSLVLETHPNAPDVTDSDIAESIATARELAHAAGATESASVATPNTLRGAFSTPAAIPEGIERPMVVLPDDFLLDSSVQSYSGGGFPSENLAVVAVDDLETVFGVDIPSATIAAYEAGTAVVADERYVSDGRIRIAAWSERAFAEGRAPDNIWEQRPGQPALADPVWDQRIGATTIDAPHQRIAIALAPNSAAALGVTTQTTRIVATFAEPPTTEALDRVRAQTELTSISPSDLFMSANYVTGPPSDAEWMIPLLTAISVLVLGASAVALGLSRFDRRPDDATLTAVGGTPLLRRGIGFWQALVITGFGTMAGATAGILPVVGFAIQSGDTLRLSDVPWGVLVGLAILLPLGIAAVNWLATPRSADLTRRTVIA